MGFEFLDDHTIGGLGVEVIHQWCQMSNIERHAFHRERQSCYLKRPYYHQMLAQPVTKRDLRYLEYYPVVAMVVIDHHYQYNVLEYCLLQVENFPFEI